MWLATMMCISVHKQQLRIVSAAVSMTVLFWVVGLSFRRTSLFRSTVFLFRSRWGVRDRVSNTAMRLVVVVIFVVIFAARTFTIRCIRRVYSTRKCSARMVSIGINIFERFVYSYMRGMGATA